MSVDASDIALDGIRRISEADLAAGRSDYHPDLAPAVKAVAQQGYDTAGKQGCAYWQQHPDAVEEIRGEAQMTAPTP